MDFFPREIRESGIFPVGRLDSDSEGLLLLSNDGDWTQILLHPSHQVWKRYWVETEQPLTPEIKKRFETGMILDGKRTLPAKVSTKGKNSTTQFEVEIREGKNRQIRRMCKKVGLEVKHLQRIVMGPIQLRSLPAGQWRFLTPKEIQQVFALQAKQKDYS
jgi:pseudouridine synthase